MIEAYLLFAASITFITYIWAVLHSQKRQGPVSKSLKNAVLGILVWLVIEFLLLMPASYGTELLFKRLLSIWGMVVMLLFLRFVYHWINRRLDWIFYVTASGAVLSAVLHLTVDSVITSITRYDYGVIDNHGPLYALAVAPSLVGGVWGMVLIFRAWVKASDDQRKSLALILLGSLVAFCLATATNLLIPMVGSNHSLPRLTPFALLPLCGLVLAAVRRHSFLALDVEFVISEILQNVTNGVVLVSRDGVVERFNRSAHEILGVPEAGPQRLRLVDLPGGYLMQQQTQRETEFDLVVGGELRSIRVTRSEEGLNGGRMLVLRNITEKKRAEAIKTFAREKFHREINRRKEERARIEKLEQVGTNAGVIAHDFNNFIAVILGFARAAHDDLEEDDPVRQDCQEILSAGFKARDIVQKVLAFSRRGTRKSTAFDLISETADAAELIRVTLPASTKIQTHFQTSTLPIKGDRARIRQALMNLLTNAYQSMLTTGGTINIYTSILDVDEEFALMYPPLETGPHALVRVDDTGEGMDQETLSRAFEPFFTKKQSAECVGLGLSTAMKIAQAGLGTIIAESELDAGTSFSMLFPLAGPSTDTEVEKSDPNSRQVMYLALGESYDKEVIDRLKKADCSFRVFGNTDLAAAHIEQNKGQIGLVIAPFEAKTEEGGSFAHSVLGATKNLPIILIVHKASVAEQALYRETGVKAIVPASAIDSQLQGHIAALLK